MARLTILAAAVLVLSGCSFAAPIPDQPSYVPPAPQTTPASLRLTGSTQPDMRLAAEATVLTANGSFVPGVAVSFAAPGAILSSDAGLTDASGRVRVFLRMPGTPVEITATAAGIRATLVVIGPATP